MQDAAQALAEKVKARQLAERVKARTAAPATEGGFDQYLPKDATGYQTTGSTPDVPFSAGELAKSVPRGAMGTVMSSVGHLGGLIRDPTDPASHLMGPDLADPEVQRSVFAQQGIQEDPRYTGSLQNKVGEGLGSASPIMLGGAMGAPVKALSLATGGQAALAALYEARARNATPAQAYAAALGNGLVASAVMAVPLGTIFGKTEAMFGDTFRRRLASYLMTTGLGAADMQAASITQQWLGNAIAQATGKERGKTATGETRSFFDATLDNIDPKDVSPAIMGLLMTAATHTRALKEAPEPAPRANLRLQEALADQQIKMREAEQLQRGAEKIAAFAEKERLQRETVPGEIPTPERAAYLQSGGAADVGPEPGAARSLAEENLAHQNDPDVVAYRAAQAKEKNAAAQTTGVEPVAGEPVAGAAASPTMRPHAPETRVERVKRAVGNTYAQLERMTRQEFGITGDSTYLSKAGEEARDPTLAAYNQRRNESRQHKVRERYFYKPLKQGLRRAKVTADEFGQILYARHAPEANKLMAERNPGSTAALAGMTDEKAAQILADARAKPNWPQVEAQIKRFDEMVQSDVQRRVDAGLLTPEQAQSYEAMYDYYAPLKTAQEGVGATGRSGIRGREFKRQLGRTSEADNPFINAVVQDQLGTSRIERNKVNVAASKFFANHPEIAKVLPESEFVGRALVGGEAKQVHDISFLDRPDVVPFKEGGKQYAMQFSKDYQSIAEALRGEGTFQRMSDSALRAIDAIPIIRQVPKYSGFVKRFVTRDNPFYWPINFIKDTSETAIRQTSERGLKFALKEQANAPKMLKELLTDGPIAQRYKAAGGMMPTMGVEDFSRVQNDVNKYLSSGRTRDALTSLREGVERGSDAVENMHRMSVFDLLTKEGMSDQRAALAAAEANVNFGKRGEIAPMMEALFPFYTAGVNGTRALSNMMKGPQFARVATTLAAGGAALDHRNRMVAGTDDNGENRYDKIPEYEKRLNLIWMDENGSGEYTKVPLVPGVGWLVNVGRNSSAALWGPSNADEAGAHMAASLIDTLNPLGTSFVNEQTGGMTNPASALSPAFARPAFEVGINKDFADREIEPENRSGQPAKPDYQRYKKNTSPTLIWATKLAAESGGPDVSPANLEHEIRGYLPGLFQELARGVNYIDKKVRGEKTEVRDIPGLRRFRGQDNPYFTEQRYYDNKQHALDTGDVARSKVISQFQKAIDALPNTPENEASRRELMAVANKTLKDLEKAKP